MKWLIEAFITLVLVIGVSQGAKYVYFEIKKAALTRVAKGLSPMEPFAQKLTGTKLDF